MKTINLKAWINGLPIRNASLVLGPTLNIIKLNKEQAMKFKQTASFQSLIKEYGKENLLKENETYKGYVVADYGFYQEVVYMHGKLVRDTDWNSYLFNPVLQKASKKGTLWKIVLDNHQVGHFLYVWTFMDCPFDRVYQELVKEGHISSEISTAKLKQKIISALITDETFQISEDEEKIMKCCVGEYFKKFFTKL